MPERRQRPTLRCPCDLRHVSVLHTYRARPEGEVAFPLPTDDYRRDLARCRLCRHVFSFHDLDMSALYAGAYVDATYGGRLKAAFDRVVALPPECSDNVGRAARVDAFAAARRGPGARPPRLLDVGSGLAVFPHRMRAVHGWACVALDPDERAVAHARSVAGVDALAGDFMDTTLEGLGPFDCVTFNKVLEHVLDPVGMLARAAALVRDDGFVYVEVPDAEAAWGDGPGREEFFIDHHHVFSPTSVAAMTERAGMRILLLERLREPSGKYTLRAFVAPAPPSP